MFFIIYFYFVWLTYIIYVGETDTINDFVFKY